MTVLSQFTSTDSAADVRETLNDLLTKYGASRTALAAAQADITSLKTRVTALEGGTVTPTPTPTPGNIFGPTDTLSTGTLATGSDVYTVSFECVSSAMAEQHFNIVNCDADGSGLGTRFTPAAGGYSVELVSIDGSNNITQVHNGTQFTQAVTAGRRLETSTNALKEIVVSENGVEVKNYGAGYIGFNNGVNKRRGRFYSPTTASKNVKIVAGA